MIRYKDYLSLMKLRIDVFITLSGLAAALAMARGPLSVNVMKTSMRNFMRER